MTFCKSRHFVGLLLDIGDTSVLGQVVGVPADPMTLGLKRWSRLGPSLNPPLLV